MRYERHDIGEWERELRAARMRRARRNAARGCTLVAGILLICAGIWLAILSALLKWPI